MNKKTTKSGITYYRLLKGEVPPDGFARFPVLMKNRSDDCQMQPHLIAARSRLDAEKIVAEDYQKAGRGYLKTEHPK